MFHEIDQRHIREEEKGKQKKNMEVVFIIGNNDSNRYRVQTDRLLYDCTQQTLPLTIFSERYVKWTDRCHSHQSLEVDNNPKTLYYRATPSKFLITTLDSVPQAPLTG